MASLKDQALLVSLSVTKPQMTKKDRKATADAEAANGAHGAGAYVKRLYPKHLIDPIVQVENEARGYMYSVTLPWNKGIQLLPSVKYMEFAERMRKYEVAFNQAVTVFLSNFANVLNEAKLAQGNLFDASEYPDLSELRQDFRFKAKYFPIADSNDFRLKVEQNVLSDIKREAEESMRLALTEAMREPYRRLFEALERIHTQCAKAETRIYDSLMDNLQELFRILPALNFTNDAKLNDLLTRCKDSIYVRPEVLRTDPHTKANVAERAKLIMEQMKGFI